MTAPKICGDNSDCEERVFISRCGKEVVCDCAVIYDDAESVFLQRKHKAHGQPSALDCIKASLLTMMDQKNTSVNSYIFRSPLRPSLKIALKPVE